MRLLVVGSVALDSVRTPFGEVKNALGGSAIYASYSASFFTGPDLVGVVGEDFPQEYLNLLKERKIDLTGLQIKKGKTFSWSGEYTANLNHCQTLSTCLNLFESFKPEIPSKYSDDKFAFLGNIDPELQLMVYKQLKNPRLLAADSMNFWIQRKKKKLVNLLKYIDLFLLNDSETRDFSGEYNLRKAAKYVLALGPKIFVVKKGEHGVIAFLKDGSFFSLPAYLLETIADPTGAGDAFGGALMGYLANCTKLNKTKIYQGLIWGSVMASYKVEGFSLNRLRSLKDKDLKKRYQEFKKITRA